MDCANCQKKECYEGKDCSGIAEKIADHYFSNKGDLEIARVASFIEARFYRKLTRVEEFINFSKEMNYTKLGIAFCIGLSEEANILQMILEKEGFIVSSVCCKVCGILKERFEFEKIEERRPEVMCNPIGQAEVLNSENVNLNIILGLCMGHDILFSKHSKAPVTTLLVKDRVLAHNPAGAIYSGYYRRKWE